MCFCLQVRFVQAEAIRKQLDGDHIVLLGNLAYSAAGEVLNCDSYSVASQAAIDLQADKLFGITVPSIQPFNLPQWLPISDAEQLLQNLLEAANMVPGDQPSGTARVYLCVPCRVYVLHPPKSVAGMLLTFTWFLPMCACRHYPSASLCRRACLVAL